jgi:hypothetical protein
MIFLWQRLKTAARLLLKSKKLNDTEMSTAFFDKSKEIANEFLQSIVFLDDEAFQNGSSRHAFDAFEVSKAFADEKKVCGIYNPTTKLDIDSFTEIAKKSDVVILDWLIKIPEVETQDNNADEDEEDPRGKYTMPIINKLISRQGLKLIIIYTGEDILDEITTAIFEDVKAIFPNKDVCEISSDNIKVLVRHKSNDIEEDKNKFKSRPHLLDKIITYKDLPNCVLSEFAKMTEGLLSNFALLSLTTIRNNSHKILGLFSKELDAAYLGHKVVLPVQSDSEDLLVKLFGDTIVDLLLYNEINKDSDINLTNWLSEKIVETDISITNKKGNTLNPTVQYKRNIALVKDLIFSNEKSIEKRFENQYKTLVKDKDQRKDYLEYLLRNTTLLFEIENEKRLEIDKKFAVLTHHKSLFMPHNIVPKLTLGTIIKSSTNPTNYYICIQQRCDSVRIRKDEERKFLFLPLSVSTDNSFHIITPDGTKLKLEKKSYSVKTIKFKCENNDGEIKGITQNDKFIFKENYDDGDTFEWILDLKDLHSQRIVTSYVSLLSRVGLDESEWLRMAGN